MFLDNCFMREFPRMVRIRGQALYLSRSVDITFGNQWKVDAIVTGGRFYKVSLSRESNVVTAKCDCMYAQTEGACKHLWATILAADTKNYMRGRGGVPTIHFERAESQPASRRQPVDIEDIDLPRSPQEPVDVPDLATQRWSAQLNTIRSLRQNLDRPPKRREREIFFTLDVQYCLTHGLCIDVLCREKTQVGKWGKIKNLSISRPDLAGMDPTDQAAIALFNSTASSFYNYEPFTIPSQYRIRGPLAASILEKLAATGKLMLRASSNTPFEDFRTLSWDGGPPWKFRVVFEKSGDSWEVTGVLRRENESVPLSAVDLVFEDGIVLLRDTAAMLDHEGTFAWISLLRRDGMIVVPRSGEAEFADAVLAGLPANTVEWPDELRIPEVATALIPGIRFLEPNSTYFRRSVQPDLRGALRFEYGNLEFAGNTAGRGAFDPETRTFLIRDAHAEQACRDLLITLGAKPSTPDYESNFSTWDVPRRRFPQVVRQLVEKGWLVEAEGKTFRRSTGHSARLSSGIDWFDLNAEVQFDSESVKLPELIRALRRGENIVRLGDGTFGLLPEEVLLRYQPLLQFAGEDEDGQIRFRKSQAALLDIFLAELPEVDTDAIFERAREEARTFTRVEPVAEPADFHGSLRDYQRIGLGWLLFLRKMGFGGCLADDMGVGKTPQVLALLETLKGQGPSLIVVPRSLIYNWKEEAARFTPKLRVLDHAHADRHDSTSEFNNYDIVLTTYGILRRDAYLLKDFQFQYAILDEAQAIKNASSDSARAARLLRAQNRLALTGTPIENHLGELWSIFEFLNPGMLGSAKAFEPAAGGQQRLFDPEMPKLLASALRPFMLRRTKAMVAKELPNRIEQTIYCELDAAQRVLYDELKNHYRGSLLRGFSQRKSKIQVLEALLRLRQAACHPALIDKRHAGVPSAKLEVLLDHIEQVTSENHKALIFSQFTSLLAIVREHLDRNAITYAYLDGKTSDRKSVVDRFQTEEDCKLFLISLKAGGVGLNLTAAEYVFLLDPWWNPAAEAQAIDRAHRIGQSNHVFAYRLIARDTVEERVLELQNSKRDLAEAIIGEDNRLVGNLTAEDLNLLLS